MILGRLCPALSLILLGAACGGARQDASVDLQPPTTPVPTPVATASSASTQASEPRSPVLSPALDLGKRLDELFHEQILLPSSCEPFQVIDAKPLRGASIHFCVEDENWRLLDEVPKTRPLLVAKGGAPLVAKLPLPGDVAEDTPSVRFRAGTRLTLAQRPARGDASVVVEFNDDVLVVKGYLPPDDVVRVFTPAPLAALSGPPVGFNLTLQVFDAPRNGALLATVHPPSSVRGMPPSIARSVQPIAVTLGKTEGGLALVRIRTQDAIVTGWVKVGSTSPIAKQPDAPEPACYGMIGKMATPPQTVTLPRGTLLLHETTREAIGVTKRDVKDLRCVRECDGKQPLMALETATGERHVFAALP